MKTRVILFNKPLNIDFSATFDGGSFENVYGYLYPEDDLLAEMLISQGDLKDYVGYLAVMAEYSMNPSIPFLPKDEAGHSYWLDKEGRKYGMGNPYSSKMFDAVLTYYDLVWEEHILDLELEELKAGLAEDCFIISQDLCRTLEGMIQNNEDTNRND